MDIYEELKNDKSMIQHIECSHTEEDEEEVSLLELFMSVYDELPTKKQQMLRKILQDKNPFNADGTEKLTPDNLARYLEKKHIVLRYNDIFHDIDIAGFKGEKTYQKDLFLNDVRFDLERYLKSCTPERLQAAITQIAMQNHYNPVLSLIDSVEYDGKDHLQIAYTALGIVNDDVSKEILKTWLKQAYCMLHNGFCGETFGCDFVLILQGSQGKGKTSFFRKLSLNTEFFGEGQTLNLDDKDSTIKASTKFITELGEIESTFKRDVQKLKAFITNTTDEYRKPYGQAYTKYPRLTSFCGTVNSCEFLVDMTGNRRFGVIPIGDEWEIFRHLDKINALQLWAQIRELVNADLKAGMTYANCFRNRELQAEIEKRNEKYCRQIPAQYEVSEILAEEAADPEDGSCTIQQVYMTASQFKSVHGEKLARFTVQQVSDALIKNGIIREKKAMRTYNKTPLYNSFLVPYKHYNIQYNY